MSEVQADPGITHSHEVWPRCQPGMGLSTSVPEQLMLPRCCGGSQKSSQQRPPPCFGCAELQSGSQRCQNPWRIEVGEGIPSLSACCSWLPFLPYPGISSWGSPCWCPRSHGSCWGQANWRGDNTVKVVEKQLKDENFGSVKGKEERGLEIPSLKEGPTGTKV